MSEQEEEMIRAEKEFTPATVYWPSATCSGLVLGLVNALQNCSGALHYSWNDSFNHTVPNSEWSAHEPRFYSNQSALSVLLSIVHFSLGAEQCDHANRHTKLLWSHILLLLCVSL